jgi:hypothetical protein
MNIEGIRRVQCATRFRSAYASVVDVECRGKSDKGRRRAETTGIKVVIEESREKTVCDVYVKLPRLKQ